MASFRAGQICIVNEYGRRREVKLICRSDANAEYWVCEDMRTRDHFPVAEKFLSEASDASPQKRKSP